MKKVRQRPKASVVCPLGKDILEIQMATDMVRRLPADELIKAIGTFRSTLRKDKKLRLPSVRVRDESSLPKGTVRVLVCGVETVTLAVTDIDAISILIECLHSIVRKRFAGTERPCA